jgi:hypothetical protein
MRAMTKRPSDTRGAISRIVAAIGNAVLSLGLAVVLLILIARTIRGSS